MTILPPQHMTTPMHTAYHSQQIDCFIQTRHQHQVLSLLLSLSCISRTALTMDSLSILCCLLPDTILHFLTEVMRLDSSLKKPLSASDDTFFQYSNSPHSPNLTYQHLVLAVTSTSHPPPAFTLSPRHANSPTVSTSLYNFFLLHRLFSISLTFPESKHS